MPERGEPNHMDDRHRSARLPGASPRRGAGGEEALHVVYLAGTGRSGSTLVERILELHDKVASAGEFGLAWLYVMDLGIPLDDLPCPCGAKLATCVYWMEVFERAGFDEAEVEDLLMLQKHLCRPRNFLLYFLPVLNRKVRERVRRAARYYERFYRAVAAASDASIVVDASNLPSSALIIREIPNIRLHVKHLVRRPESYLCSWSTVKYHAGFDNAPTDTKGPLNAALEWLFLNLMVEALRLVVPVKRYRYERLTQSPRRSIGAMMGDVPGFAGDGEGPFVSDTEIDLPPGHAFLGNPDRFTSGRTVIRQDERYRTDLPLKHRVLSVAVSLPLYILYGYAWMFGGKRRNRTPEDSVPAA